MQSGALRFRFNLEVFYLKRMLTAFCLIAMVAGCANAQAVKPTGFSPVPDNEFKPILIDDYKSDPTVPPEPSPTPTPTLPPDPTPTPKPKPKPRPTPKPVFHSIITAVNGWIADNNVSWYGPGFYGKRTACGLAFTTTLLGVAHRSLPCGTLVEFKYNGRSITVPVVDRGPYVAGRQWDLSGGLCVYLNHCFTGPLYYRIP